jgi:hypothetical protein
MTTYIPPKKGAQYIFYAGLVSQSTGQFQANPTIASGDFKVSIDGGALNNLATLPAVTPATSRMVKFTLSTSEMNGDNITVVGVDAAGSEWDEIIVSIQTSVNQIDDLATSAALATVQADTDNIQTRLPAALSGDGFMKADLKSIEDELTSGNNATLRLKQLDITSSTVTPVRIVSAGAGVQAVYVESSQGPVVEIQGTAGAYNAVSVVGVEGNGVYVEAAGKAVYLYSDNDDALYAQSAGAGKSINAPQNIAVSDGNLTLAAIATAVWANATRTLTAISDSAGITTLLSRVTAILGIYTAADIRSAVGLASANIDTQLDAIPTATENADALLKRDWTSVTGEAARSVLNALRKLRNKVSFDGANTLTTTKEDDTTAAYTQSVVEDSSQDPFKSIG